MTDIIKKNLRSYNMSQIKSKNTKPEIIVRKFCHALGLRYKLHEKKLPGKPDLFFPKHKAVIFVNGCFWHRHNCMLGRAFPKTNISFWNEKFKNTILRDKKNYQELLANNIKIIKIWECEIRNKAFKSKILKFFNK